MTLVELNQLLKQTGYPVAYSHFNSPKEAPFITYLEAFSNNSFADNKVYRKVKNVQVELYTNYKDLTAETTLETILDANEIPYETTEHLSSQNNYFRKYMKLE